MKNLKLTALAALLIASVAQAGVIPPPAWKKKTITYSDLATAGGSKTLTIQSLAKKNILKDVVIKTLTPFAFPGGGVPGGSSFYAIYDSSINADSSTGVGTGTAAGGAAISSNKLLLSGSGSQVTYAATGNANFTQTGTIRFNLTPHYSGQPAASQHFFTIKPASTAANIIEFVHYSDSGDLLFYVYDSAGVQIGSTMAGVWSPVAETTYEIELDIDVTGGLIHDFINGAVFATSNATGTRSNAATTFGPGLDFDFGPGNQNFSIDHLTIFPTIQHTAAFTGEIPRSYGSSLVLSMGNSLNGTTRYASGYDLTALAGASNYLSNSPFPAYVDNLAAAMGLTITATGGAALNTLTAGSVEVWTHAEQLP